MAVRNGAAYLAGLRDGRSIWLRGKRVADVTTEPGLARTAQTIAAYYDFQSRPELCDLMTYETDDDDRAPVSFIQPRSKDDLRRRADAYAAWAEVSCGLMGRSPDYMNAAVAAVGMAQSFWGRADPALGEHAQNVYLRCRRGDLCLTHTFITPMVDRFKALKDQEPYTNAGVVRRTEDGIVVRGAKSVATLAPFADENLLLSLGALNKLESESADYAICFNLPLDTPGLSFIGRDVLDDGSSHFDRPLAGRFEEMDCLAVFDDVSVPWESVYAYRDVDIGNEAVRGLHFTESLGHQVVCKNVAKTRLLLGLAHLLAESTQVSSFINVQEKLGDITTALMTMESLALAAVEGAYQADNGFWYCNPAAINSALRLYPDFYVQIVDHLKQIGGSGYVAMPAEATLDALGPAVENYFRGATLDAHGKVQLFRLAWDIAGSGWGGRQELYERFFFGDRTRMRAGLYMGYDKTEAIAMVRRMLEPPKPGEPLPLPERFAREAVAVRGE